MKSLSDIAVNGLAGDAVSRSAVARAASVAFRAFDVVIDRIGGGDPASRRRLRVTFLGPDAYRVVEESSLAGKEDWTAGTQTMTRRIE